MMSCHDDVIRWFPWVYGGSRSVRAGQRLSTLRFVVETKFSESWSIFLPWVFVGRVMAIYFINDHNGHVLHRVCCGVEMHHHRRLVSPPVCNVESMAVDPPVEGLSSFSHILMTTPLHWIRYIILEDLPEEVTFILNCWPVMSLVNTSSVVEVYWWHFHHVDLWWTSPALIPEQPKSSPYN